MTDVENEASNGKEVHNFVEGERETAPKMQKKRQCPDCPYSCDTKQQFERHRRTHTGERPYQCDRCEKAFADRNTLKKHLLIHSRDNHFVCGTCGMEFKRRDHLKRHHQRRHTENKKPSRDPRCGIECFKSRESSENPSQTSSEEGDPAKTSSLKYRCPLCPYSTPHSGSFDNHCRTHTGEKPFPCDRCDRAFGKRTDLRRHIRSLHSGYLPFTCGTCEKGFKRKDGLRRHERSHACGRVQKEDIEPTQDPLVEKADDIDSSKSKAEPISEEASSKSEVEPISEEANSKSKVEPISEEASSKSKVEPISEEASSKSEVGPSSPTSSGERKRRKTHLLDGKHRCPECTYTTNHKSKLSLHQRVHSGEKPFGCDQCGRAFSQKSILNRHLLSHGRCRVFTCGTCGKRYTRKDHFQKHEKSHGGERSCQDPVPDEKADSNEGSMSVVVSPSPQKPLQKKKTIKRHHCPACTYSSTRRKRVDDHLQTHLFENPFMCDHCGEAFPKKCHLQRHIRTHTGDVHNFVCGKCDERFKREEDLLQHEERHLQEPSD